MTTRRQEHTATLLPDGTVLIAGSQIGGGNGGSALASAESCDPATARFSHTLGGITRNGMENLACHPLEM